MSDDGHTSDGRCKYPKSCEIEDAHMVETLRLRTAALHRVSRSNDQLRRELEITQRALVAVAELVDNDQSRSDSQAVIDAMPLVRALRQRARLAKKP